MRRFHLGCYEFPAGVLGVQVHVDLVVNQHELHFRSVAHVAVEYGYELNVALLSVEGKPADIFDTK